MTSGPEPSLRIKLTAVAGLVVTLGSLAGVLWLLDVFSPQEYPAPYILSVDELECATPLKFNFAFSVEYGLPEGRPERQGDGTLAVVSITPRFESMASHRFPELGCKFHVESSAPIRNALVTNIDGDDRAPEVIDVSGKGSGPWSVRLDSETFGGYLWLYLDDISLSSGFQDRIARMSAKFTSSTKGVLYQSDEDPEPHQLVASVTLPTEHQVKAFAPYDMRIRGRSIYASDPVELADHEWQYGIDVTYASTQRTQLYQILLITFSTLFGVGVSAVIEAFLASGLLTLHRYSLARGPDNATVVSDRIEEGVPDNSAVVPDLKPAVTVESDQLVEPRNTIPVPNENPE